MPHLLYGYFMILFIFFRFLLPLNKLHRLRLLVQQSSHKVVVAVHTAADVLHAIPLPPGDAALQIVLPPQPIDLGDGLADVRPGPAHLAEALEGALEEDGPLDTDVLQEDGLQELLVHVDVVDAADLAALLERHVVAPRPGVEGREPHVEDVGDLAQDDVVLDEVAQGRALLV